MHTELQQPWTSGIPCSFYCTLLLNGVDWKSAKGVEAAEILLAHDPDRLRQELHGIAKSDESLLFKHLLHMLRNRPLWTFETKPKVIYHFLDPR